MKVLVCDDTMINRQILGAYLHHMGHEVVYAENGKQAIEVFGKENLDLVLIDVEMPGMDGYEATREIRASLHEFSGWTPIIFISSHMDDASIVKGIEAGGDDYLIKPVSKAVLQAKIHAMRRLVAMRQDLINYHQKLEETNKQLEHSNALLSALSLKDPLTELGNRRAFEENILKGYRLASRDKRPMSILMIDVDNFKLYNDHYGHQAGDQCLKQVGGVLLKGTQRPTDFAARYGGEEFVVILLETPILGAAHVAEILRAGIEALQLEHKYAARGIVTVSIGAATFDEDTPFDSPDALVAAADAALYRAKEGGRNRVVAANLNS